MSLAKVFVHRPIAASVLSLLILLLGLIAMKNLPISEYPQVVPPTIGIRAQYPGATPQTIADTVASPLEQQIAGIPGLLYQSSQATLDGAMSLVLTFAIGTNLDNALVEVQNRISQASPKLPEEVRRLGVVSEKASTDLTLVVHLVSPEKTVTPLELANFARLRVKDALAAVPGVGNVRVFGPGEYGMRIWMDPDRLTSLNLTADQIIAAVREQNAQITPGSLGSQPSGAPFQVTVTAPGRLQTTEEFGAIVVRNGAAGQLVHLRDVARIEMGSSNYNLRSLLTMRGPDGALKYHNDLATAIPIFQAPGSNALQISDGVRAKMKELQATFPAGVTYDVVYDPTRFIAESIDKVQWTLIEAVGLVVIVVILFLQTWRAALIPLLAVPVSIIGTFAAMYVLGFSINNLSLFGLVLAIGIVVDDAIVVVENVERNIARGLTPSRASVVAMGEVTGPIVATAAVLCAVFIPTAFMSGLTGRFYQQFAITIAISTIISTINSLTLSPALCAVLLRRHDQKPDLVQRGIDVIFNRVVFRPFNTFFAWSSRSYQWGIGRLVRASAIMLLLFAGMLGLTWFGFATTPTGFIPEQDKTYLIAIAQLPDGAGLERTDAVIRNMSDIAMENPAVQGAVAFPGLSIAGFSNAPNAGIVFIRLKDHKERRDPSMSANAVAQALSGMFFMRVPEAFVIALSPPPVAGLGSSGGFKLFIQDRSAQGLEKLYGVTQMVMGAARATPMINGNKTYSVQNMGVPQVALSIDIDKAKAAGIDRSAIANALAAHLGSVYANDFNAFDRTWQVLLQADSIFRNDPSILDRVTVRAANGTMAPLSAFIAVRETAGPDRVMHYNGQLSIDISTDAAPGFSGDQAQAAMREILAKTLPPGYSYELTDVAYQQQLAGSASTWVFPLCVVLVFLVLAALYESWLLPLAVILIVPLCLLFALAGVRLAGLDNNIMVQIGFLVLMGLACKNAILIVEFAKDAEARGVGIVRAALDACRLRLRPILMTSFAFIMGVVPLMISTGAGAEMRRSMGVAVFSGMLGVTIVGLLLTPVFYVVLRRLSGRSLATGHAGPDQAEAQHSKDHS